MFLSHEVCDNSRKQTLCKLYQHGQTVSSSKAWLNHLLPVPGKGSPQLTDVPDPPPHLPQGPRAHGSRRVHRAWLSPVAGDTQVHLPRAPLLGGVGVPFIVHLVKTQMTFGYEAGGLTFCAGNTQVASDGRAPVRCCCPGIKWPSCGCFYKLDSG